MLSFNNIACRRDGVLLFSGVSLVIQSGQKVGLTGANGSGKSSLFAMILGGLDLDEGELSLQSNTSITHVAQETPSSSASARDYVIDGDQRIRALEVALAGINSSDGIRHASLLEDYEQAGGYRVKARAGALLNGLGFSSDQHEAAVSTFSGGWRMRLNLAQALMSPSDLLLLDEPTNHLDLDAVLWLEQWLRQLDSTLILISHDREFLDRTTTHTLSIEQKRINLYTGNYSEFEIQRASRLANQQAQYEKQQKRKAEVQSFVDRFRAKATKARQAQSRLKMLERMTTLAPATVDSPFHFEFRKPDSLPDPLVLLRDASVGYHGSAVLSKLNLNVQCGDRLALLGANGAGKSTFIKAIVGELGLLHGERLPAQRLSIGYFAQHQVDQLRDDHSPLQTMLHIDPTLSDSDARRFLGGFGFNGDQALQVVHTLSGGERARLALALIVYARPNLLLLDEPTNHLDINMRQALAEALQNFSGALLVISHDRTLLRSVVDNLWLVADGTLQPFTDDLDGYARWLNDYRNQTNTTRAQSSQREAPGDISVSSEVSATERKQRKREEAQLRVTLQPLHRAVRQAEVKLDQWTEKLATVRDKLGANELYNVENKAVLADLLMLEAQYKQQITSAEEHLLDSMQLLEQAESIAAG